MVQVTWHALFDLVEPSFCCCGPKPLDCVRVSGFLTALRTIIHSPMAVLQKVAGADTSLEIKNILKEVDRNGDGRIDYEEFCDMMRQV